MRHGEILSLILFNYYINDIITKVSNIEHGCKFGMSRIKLISYADDMMIITYSIIGLNIIYEKF